MTTKFEMTRDINGYNGFGLAFADDRYSVTLTANTEATVTVPGGAARYLAVFMYEPGTSVWVAQNDTAAIPAGNTFAATTSDGNPAARTVKAGDVLSVITAAATADVWVGFYALA